MAQAWKITRRQGVCSGCEGSFEDGETHFSRIRIVGDELVREDLHKGCFEVPEDDPAEGSTEDSSGGAEDGAASDSGTADRPLFWWRTKFEVHAPKKGLRLDLESLEALFMGLEGREERGVRELRYVLCLLLMRKRRVKVLKVNRSAEGESFTVKRPRRDEKLCVWVYDFEPERMDELRAELIAIFDGSATENPEGGEPEPGDADSDGSEPSGEPEDLESALPESTSEERIPPEPEGATELAEDPDGEDPLATVVPAASDR